MTLTTIEVKLIRKDNRHELHVYHNSATALVVTVANVSEPVQHFALKGLEAQLKQERFCRVGSMKAYLLRQKCFSVTDLREFFDELDKL